jgi:hypothetical protein
MQPSANLEGEKRKTLIICVKYSAAAEPAYTRAKANSRAAFAQPPQELIRGNNEWVLLQNAADDDHWMGPHDVNNDPRAGLGEIICSYDRAFI